MTVRMATDCNACANYQLETINIWNIECLKDNLKLSQPQRNHNSTQLRITKVGFDTTTTNHHHPPPQPTTSNFKGRCVGSITTITTTPTTKATFNLLKTRQTTNTKHQQLFGVVTQLNLIWFVTLFLLNLYTG